MNLCDYWWGSHACDLPEGHKGFHVCHDGPDDGLCSEYDGVRVRFEGVGEWRPTGGGRTRDILDAPFFLEAVTGHD